MCCAVFKARITTRTRVILLFDILSWDACFIFEVGRKHDSRNGKCCPLLPSFRWRYVEVMPIVMIHTHLLWLGQAYMP